MLGPKDAFDSRALVHGAAGEDFIAAEETLCYLIPRSLVLGLIARNPGFAAFFYSEVSPSSTPSSAPTARKAWKACCGPGCGRRAAARRSWSRAMRRWRRRRPRMQDANINAVYVRENGRIGVVTGMNLAKAVLLQRLPLDTPVRRSAISTSSRWMPRISSSRRCC